MLTQAEILDIFEKHLYADGTEQVYGENKAAEAIAAKFERARLILELLADDPDDHQVDECIKAAKELRGREGAT